MKEFFLKLFKKVKGFSLIELLGVIVIIAIIVTIVVPTIQGTIDDARKSAFESSVTRIKDGAVNECMRRLMSTGTEEVIYTFELSHQSISPDTYPVLEFKGKSPAAGYIITYEDCTVEYGLTDRSYYMSKTRTGKVTESVPYIQDSPEQPLAPL